MKAYSVESNLGLYFQLDLERFQEIEGRLFVVVVVVVVVIVVNHS